MQEDRYIQVTENRVVDLHKIDPLQREYPVPETKTITVKTKNGKTRYRLPDFNELARGVILGLWIRQKDSGGAGRASDDSGLINDTALLKGFLTLTSSGKELVSRTPLILFSSSTPDGQYTQLWNPFELDPTECYLDFSGDGSSLVDDEVVEMTWIYSDPKHCLI